ncbi:hypothetical protein JZ751_029131 [Albula glossodonta]|uniref:Uncharacterized protein n=1 Tax=Albula glossodonta TaxID=121402 RepID=A0A8T2P887_9TELE|nr:hypothetical protein JZ751_029131 [Albula glossodonta]
MGWTYAFEHCSSQYKTLTFLSLFLYSMDSPNDSTEDVSTALEIEESQPMEGVFHSHLDERVRPYIDLIDSLRVIGIEKDLALPAIAVIGDQSSGKSSVLEALSGVALPRGSGKSHTHTHTHPNSQHITQQSLSLSLSLSHTHTHTQTHTQTYNIWFQRLSSSAGIVTRCPLELKLRKLRGGIQWRAVISYKDEVIQFDDPLLVEGYVAKAQNELAGEGVGICDELITLEISAPDVCDLTLIDLPGIARVPVKGQPEDIGDQIKNLILNFIEKNETIILVVVPCNVDIATTEALRMAQEADPEGKRTLAILTKPDLVDKGTEKNVLDIVRNQVIPLSKGYIIVKCRGQKQINDRISLSDATKIERDFFRRHEYFRYKSLPLISEQIKKQLWDTRTDLGQCERGPPLEPQQRKTFLIDTLTHFNDKIKRLSTGEVVNDENLFIQLRSEFKKWNDHLDSTKDTFHTIVQDVVKEYDLKHRGRELPGFSDYNVFEMVVQKLVTKLREPAMETMKTIREMVQMQFTDVAKNCFQHFPFLQCVSSNKIDNIQSNQEALVQERILEQFEMEQLVYTQDGIYYKTLNECGRTGEKASEDNCAGFDSRTKYPEMLRAYYEIVVQRLADQVPMLIRFFLLKESSRMLCREMLNLMDGGNVNEILREETDVSRRRIDMQNRVERLTLAQAKIAKFF